MRLHGTPHARRTWTLLLVGALLLGQLGSFLHHSTERHEVCEEHGELVHGPGVETDAEEPAEEGPLARRSEGAGTEHGHCQLTLALRTEVAHVGAAGPSPIAPPVALSTHVGESAALRGVPLILEAPKQSPPV